VQRASAKGEYVKTVVIYSGGMDSFTLLNQCLQQGEQVHAISFNYGQRHANKELATATKYAASIKLPHQVVDLAAIKPLLRGSALTDNVDVPQGHYEESNMRLTVVPNRNMIMLSLAIAYAVSADAEVVKFGAHAGDHAIYPDCREKFVFLMHQAARCANYHPVSVVAPFIDDTKFEILALGFSLGLDYSNTWTCYEGKDVACGKCGSCQERLEAFSQHGKPDPLPYATRELIKKT
jgi:7-cyano-7-deazaguanine synthase